MTTVLCVGLAVLDYVYAVDELPRDGQKYRAKDLAVVGGGLAANAAVAVARLGGRALLATRFGDDGIAAETIAGLEAEGVDCRLARRFPGRRSPVSAILVDRHGERLIVSYSDPQMPDAPDWLPDALPAGTAAVHGDTRWESGARRVFERARAAGIPSVLDCDRAPADPDFLAVPTHVAFSAQGLCEMMAIDDPRAALAALARRRPANWVAVTAGGDGVYFIEDGAAAHEPGFRVTVVDTLAAGDVWHGAFALALGEGMPERPAVRFASAAAALKCTRFGGRAGTPDRAAVETLLKESA